MGFPEKTVPVFTAILTAELLAVSSKVSESDFQNKFDFFSNVEQYSFLLNKHIVQHSPSLICVVQRPYLPLLSFFDAALSSSVSATNLGRFSASEFHIYKGGQID